MKDYSRWTKHGETVGRKLSTEYQCYRSMRARCNRPKNKSYPDYGGRGIKVCERWMDSFSNFLEDMGRKPSQEHSIERIDHNGNYEPSNCKWASKKEQMANRRNSIYIEFNGIRKLQVRWAESVGASENSIKYRIDHGWTIEEALTLERDRKTLRKQFQRPSIAYTFGHLK